MDNSEMWPVYEKYFVECDCSTHGLNFLVSQDKDTPFKSLDVSYWRYGQGKRMDWTERVRNCWHIFWEGKPHPDEITFHDKSDNLPGLVQFLNKHFPASKHGEPKKYIPMIEFGGTSSVDKIFTVGTSTAGEWKYLNLPIIVKKKPRPIKKSKARRKK